MPYFNRVTFGRSVAALRGKPALRNQARRNIPLATVVSNDRHGLSVVACEHTFDHVAPTGLKTDAIADPEFEHAGVRTHLLEEAKAFDNPMVQVDEFGFAQPVDVDLCHLATISLKRPTSPVDWWTPALPADRQ
jgi:hypothetical protein